MRPLDLLLALNALALTGCAALAPGEPSVETVELTAQAAATVADDLVRMLTRRYGPAETLLVLPHPRRPLGESLERALRRAGYAVRTDGAAAGVPVAYVVDGFAPDQVLVRVRVGPEDRLARVYTIQGGRAIPASAFTHAQGADSP